MNYSEFKNWRKSISSDMQDLTYAHPDDFFIFTRFAIHKPVKLVSEQILYTDSIEEVFEYLRHIFIYDILTDTVDDLEFDFNNTFSESQKNSIKLLNYWFKFGKESKKINYKEINQLINDFNNDFNREELEYRIEILNGVDELREFLLKRYSNNNKLDKEKLENICSSDFFVGKKVKELLDDLLAK